ncbi:hypothetical protein [Candidatus Pandoraea novymonadis]|uniref:hypothetical protein n=1 Tax=Candidatus Pandoraea novymonadis TaxID=1808959 RepID=UPI001C6393BB|nr:hypothetical protein [Candidatus Pandoraea novymonadis]
MLVSAEAAGGVGKIRMVKPANIPKPKFDCEGSTRSRRLATLILDELISAWVTRSGVVLSN